MRLQLSALAYNIGNFLRRLVLPSRVGHWRLTTLRERLIKIGAKAVRHSKYVTFQLSRGGGSAKAVRYHPETYPTFACRAICGAVMMT